jgi:hypothetical protein
VQAGDVVEIVAALLVHALRQAQQQAGDIDAQREQLHLRHLELIEAEFAVDAFEEIEQLAPSRASSACPSRSVVVRAFFPDRMTTNVVANASQRKMPTSDSGTASMIVTKAASTSRFHLDEKSSRAQLAFVFTTAQRVFQLMLTFRGGDDGYF